MNFKEVVKSGYQTQGDFIVLGGAVFNGEIQKDLVVTAPLKTFNRHGLIAGATGTGKTKTLQVIAESLSSKGVPVLLMDIKGDLSGLAEAGVENDKILAKHLALGIDWKSHAFPVELMSLTGVNGVHLRSTVSEFGPVLFSKILDLNDTQGGVVSLVFKYSDDHQLPLLDLKDFKSVLQYLINEGKPEIKKEYGSISTATASTILRKIIEIEEQGAENFFGEVSFEIDDLLRIDDKGQGVISIIRLTDIQDKPKLFSTFMLSLLAEVYQKLPEEGDLDQPKLVMFIDEAHLIFNEASKALLVQLETIIKLIRSKGVGIFFCTQMPTDVPASVLSQLGMKVQHALRAFTANDRKAIKMVSQNYPETDFYKTEDLLTQLGIGEALVTVLTEKGTPSPLVHTAICAPRSRMDILEEEEINEVLKNSKLLEKYNNYVDRESASELLLKKLKDADSDEEKETNSSKSKKVEKNVPQESMVGDIIDSTVGRQVARTVAREVTRGLLGILGLSGNSSRKKK